MAAWAGGIGEDCLEEEILGERLFVIVIVIVFWERAAACRQFRRLEAALSQCSLSHVDGCKYRVRLLGLTVSNIRRGWLGYTVANIG